MLKSQIWIDFISEISIDQCQHVKISYMDWFYFRDPNRPMSVPVTWPKYDDHHKQYLEISTPMNDKSVKSRPNEKRFYFWNNLIPSLTSGPFTSCVQPNLGQYAFCTMQTTE